MNTKSFFTATIKTDVSTYFIDLKSGDDYHKLRNKYAVIHNGGAVYLDTLQDCIEWIESYDQSLLAQAV
ncbi:MAG: hypothetical protein RLY89_1570 [Bacteroidota bacterium]|jgi:hypothetical protein